MPDRASEPPVTRIRPPSPWGGLGLGELVRFRELAYRLARRDVTLRYRQTLLGVVWVVLQPLLTAGAFTLVFGRVAGLPAPDGTPYFLVALWGSTSFTAFNACLLRSSQSLVGNSALVSKVYFPRLLLPLSATGSVALDTAVATVLGIGIGLAWGVPPGWALLTLPLWFLMLLMLGLAVGLLFAPLVLKYRDVAYVLPLLTQLLLYLSPVGYALSAVPAELRTPVLLNPLAPLVEAVRWSALGTSPPPAWSPALAVGVVLVILTVATAAFRRQERVFADVV